MDLVLRQIAHKLSRIYALIRFKLGSIFNGDNSDMVTSKDISCDMRERAFKICRDYLHGAWKALTIQDLQMKHISGGLSNLLYYCALPATAQVKAKEPSEVLVRFYGQVHGEEAIESLLAESVIFTLLSERRLGPRLYGVFPGGRIEQYIPARSLLAQELAQPPISRQIAIRMARIHSMNVPISKEPTWIWKSMERWLKSSEDFLRKPPPNGPPNPSSSSVLERLKSFSYREEMDYMRHLVKRIQSPVVFAHNDMQEGNILYNTNIIKESDRISLIDFEYCSYNYRGFDLANHFCEWIYSYKNPAFPFFDVNESNFPDKDKQLNFIRAYLAAYYEECSAPVVIESNPEGASVVKKKSKPPMTPAPSLDEDQLLFDEDTPAPPHPLEERLLKEVIAFKLTSHLFWGLWSIVQGHVSKIPFGYLEYALVRMEHYYKDKSVVNELLQL